MIRGTTPTFSLKIRDESVDLTEALNVYVTFTQLSKVLTKSGEDLVVTPHQVDVYLSQAETLEFTVGDVEVQLNYTYAGGQRAASRIAMIRIDKNLIGRELV